MEKEIRVRRKWFLAFLLALVLICSSVVPMRVEAEDSYTNSRESLEGRILAVGDKIVVSGECTITYLDWSGKPLIEQEKITLNADEPYSVRDYAFDEVGELDSSIFGGWEVQSDPTRSGDYIDTITVQATDKRYKAGVLYIDELDVQGETLDLETCFPKGFIQKDSVKVAKRVYSAEALKAFAGTLTYKGNTYVNPKVELIVDDNTYGVYNVNGTELTIYAVPSYEFLSDETTGAASYYIYGNYFMEADSTKYYDKVTFASGSIKYADENGKEYKVASVTIMESETAGDGSGAVGKYVIYADNMNIYNESATPVTVKGSAELWVSWGETLLNTEEGAINISYEKPDTFDNTVTFFARSGDKVTIEPKESYSLFGIELRKDYAAYSDLKWQETYIEHCTDGTKVVTIPNVSSTLFVNAGLMTELKVGVLSAEEYVGADYSPYVRFIGVPLNIGNEDWYKESFVISALKGYQICELTEAVGEEQWRQKVEVSEEGIKEKTYVLLNKSSTSPSGENRYGEIIKLNYTYTMDLESPVIDADTGVTMTGADGKTVPLSGSWKLAEDTEITKVTWTNQESVTITVNAEAGDGLPIAGYQIHVAGEDNTDFQPENTRTLTGNGKYELYELYICVQDEFDKMTTERGSKNHWVAALGIDTIKPKIYYIDDKNNSANIELISNYKYEGELYLVAEDNASGVFKVTAYESADGVWTENNSVLTSIHGFGRMYCISQAAKDKVYRIAIIDAAGNETIYENITVKAADNGGTTIPDESEPSAPEGSVPSNPTVPGEGVAGALIQQGGIVGVKAGIPYSLGSGTWKVKGDNTSYAGGITFYVETDGEYEFTLE